MNDTIDDIDKAIKELRERRKALIKESKKIDRLQLDEYMIELLDIIQKNPGIDNSGIQMLMELTTKEMYNNKMIALRRNRSLIVNKGTRRSPEWYCTDKPLNKG